MALTGGATGGVTEAAGMTETGGMTEGTEETRAAGVTEAAGITEGTDAAGVIEATDAEGWRGARGAGATDADALRRSNSMKFFYEGRTEEIRIFV